MTAQPRNQLDTGLLHHCSTLAPLGLVGGKPRIWNLESGIWNLEFGILLKSDNEMNKNNY